MTVDGTEIAVVQSEEKDYISLTDMVRKIENGLALIEKWLRNKNTIEFLGIWEEMYNPNFNSPNSRELKMKRIKPFCIIRKTMDGENKFSWHNRKGGQIRWYICT